MATDSDIGSPLVPLLSGSLVTLRRAVRLIKHVFCRSQHCSRTGIRDPSYVVGPNEQVGPYVQSTGLPSACGEKVNRAVGDRQREIVVRQTG